MMTRALIFAEQGKLEDALKAVDAAKAFAPDSPIIPDIGKFRQQLDEALKNKDKDKDAGGEDG
jgi:hypothetical protein